MVNELFSPQSIHNPGPLGLNLTNSRSFVELIQKKLEHATNIRRAQETNNVHCYGAIHSNSTTTEGMNPSKKMQAAKFEASFLRIGDWEVNSLRTKLIFVHYSIINTLILHVFIW
jgi:hypothetical protein